MANSNDLFDYVKSINKKIEIEVDPVKYKAYTINRAFSNTMDTVFHAVEASKFTDVEPEIHYLFYYNSVNKNPSRFGKWYKNQNDKYIDIIKENYDYSNEKARSVINLFTPEQLELLEKEIDKGGTNNDRGYI